MQATTETSTAGREASAFEQNLAVLYEEFQEQIRINKQMEMEISVLKAKIDESRGGQRKVVASTTTSSATTVEADLSAQKTISEDEWIKVLTSTGTGDAKQVKEHFEKTRKEAEEKMKKEAEEIAARK